MAYAILRFAKHKGGASKALSAHHERTKEIYASNPDIDKSLTVQNYHLIAPHWSYGQEIRWQDDFYACMSERWLELERGAPAVETKRKHLTPQWYKKVTAMDAKLEKLETALNGINVLNAGKKRKEAVETFKQLLPEVESFQAEIQRMQQAVSQSLSMQRCSVEESEALKDELAAERRKSAAQRAKLAVLEERYKRAEKLLRQLPKEVTERSKREYRET